MDLYNKFFNEYINLFPSINDNLNLPKYKHLRVHLENSISPEHIKKVNNFYKKYKKILAKKKKLNIYDKVLLYEIKLNLESTKYKLEYMPITQMSNIISDYMQMLNGTSIYIFEKEQDYLDFMKKNKEFSAFCCQMITNMNKGIQKGLIQPTKIVEMVISDIENILKNKDYINKKVPKKIKKEWDENVKNYVLDPTNNILVYLKKIYIKNSRKTLGYSSLPDGKNMYKFMVKAYTTNSKLSVKEIHNMGLSEVKRVYSEMEKIMRKLNYKKGFKSFVKYVQTLPSNKFKNEKEVLDQYKQTRKYLWDKIMPEYFDLKIKKNYKIKKVPAAIAPSMPAAYYMGGSLDGKRDGVFWLNTRNVKGMLKSDDLALSKHEGIPGHHFQITYTNESKKIPLFIKIGNYNGYIEGWALYSENLGKYRNELEYFGKLNSEMLRSVRLVVDTGIHYYNWSYEKCFKLFKKYTTMADTEIKAEIYRYIADPGQALSYKIGELTILNLRKEYLKNKKHTLKKFHTLVLEDGPLPLDILIEKIKKT